MCQRFQKEKQDFQALFNNLDGELKTKYELDNSCANKLTNLFADKKKKGKKRS